MKKFNNKKAFTLIELLVVIAVLGVLVLLATPRLLGKTDNAFTTSIKHDARLVQDAAERYYLDNDEFPFLYEEDEEGVLEAVVAGSPNQYEILHKVIGFDNDNPNVKLYEIDFRKLDNYVKVNNDEGYFVAAKGNPDFGVTALKPGVRSTEERLNNVVIDDDNSEDNKLEFPSPYELGTDEDFEFVPSQSGAANEYARGKGYYKYIGDKEYVIIPHKVDGEILRDYFNMFRNSDVKGVASNSPYIEHMNSMFSGSKADHLELKYLDTASVERMSYMFDNSNATSIDFSNFDTSNVWSMSGMFKDSSVIELDLSSFDLSKLNSTTMMFYRSSVQTVYVRTEADAKRIKNVTDRPNFQVTIKNN